MSIDNLDKPPFWRQAGLNHGNCLGAAIIMSFLIDLFTASGKDAFSKTDVLIVLDAIARKELPDGLFELVKDTADKLNPPDKGEQSHER